MPADPQPRLPSEPLIDAESVARVREEFGAEIYASALAVFWPKVDEDCTACAAAIAAGREREWRALAHAIKGSASSMGFASLAACAARIERVERTGPQAIAQLRAVLARTRRDHGTT